MHIDENQEPIGSWTQDMIASILDLSDIAGGTTSVISNRPDTKFFLWQWLDYSDFSSARFFIAEPDPAVRYVFEVDFLSRHEIIPPITKESLPPGWEDWGASKGNSILVCNKEEFIKRTLTSDAFLALPKYRFEALADDTAEIWHGSGGPVWLAAWQTLTEAVTGYSFNLYVDPNLDGKTPHIAVVNSCLNGRQYEDSRMLRLASEQHHLREDQ